MLRIGSTLLFGSLLIRAVCAQPVIAHSPQTPADSPTIQVSSRLVFLDVTVLDKKGHPVVSGLTQGDFAITEEKRPQQIFSFERPETHVADGVESEDNPSGKAPLTIFVLDLLNSNFADFAYIRYSVRKFLMAQPEHLAAPAELMVLGNQSLELLQGYTWSKEELLNALGHVPVALPYKFMSGAFYPERFAQSIDALQQIALQNKGVPGRKNIVWVGHGGPGIFTDILTGPIVEDLNQYVRDTTNMLVDSRVSLFVVYPGLKARGPALTLSEGSAEANIGDNDPFAGDINFGVFVNETGGTLLFGRNDVDREIVRAQELGSDYYTLTYQPRGGSANGKFRRIRVAMRDPELRAVTKAGYFAPDQNAPVDPRLQTMTSLIEAAQSSIPFRAIDLTIQNVVRHPDTRSAEFTVALKPGSLTWEQAGVTKSIASVAVAATSLSQENEILASKRETLTITANTQDATRLATMPALLPVSIRLSRKTKKIRVAVQVVQGGRIGTAELDRKTIDGAPEAPTTQQKLLPRAQDQTAPAP